MPIPPLTAVVTDFLQEHMDPEHDPVEGMLGMVRLLHWTKLGRVANLF